MSSLFAHVDSDGTLLASNGVLSVSRGTGQIPAKTYILELAREVVPSRCHVSASCRTTITAPAERYNTGFLDGTRVGVTWLGEEDYCDMAFTIVVEEF